LYTKVDAGANTETIMAQSAESNIEPIAQPTPDALL
jgi:hypothetical protein